MSECMYERCVHHLSSSFLINIKLYQCGTQLIITIIHIRTAVVTGKLNLTNLLKIIFLKKIDAYIESKTSKIVY